MPHAVLPRPTSHVVSLGSGLAALVRPLCAVLVAAQIPWSQAVGFDPWATRILLALIANVLPETSHGWIHGLANHGGL